MAWDCEVCRGSGQIRLPLYRRSTASFVATPMPEAVEDNFRVFPCPACSPWAEPDRVNVMRFNTSADVPEEIANDPVAIEHIQRSSAHNLVGALLKQNLIRFERVIEPRRLHMVRILGTAGVVSRSAVATIEERIEKNQGEVADEVVVAIKAEVANWNSGSRYVDHRIDKGDVCYLIDQAVAAVRAKRKERSTMLAKEKHAKDSR